MVPFSAQWIFVEPEAGKRDYADLDRYVDWCEKNGVKDVVEIKFGYPNRDIFAHAAQLSNCIS